MPTSCGANQRPPTCQGSRGLSKVLVALALGAGVTAASGQLQLDGPLGGIEVPSVSAPECEAISYRPVPLFDRPGGRAIGKLVLDHPELARTTQPSCEARPVMQIALPGAAPVALQALEVGYEHSVPVVFAVKRIAGPRGTR